MTLRYVRLDELAEGVRGHEGQDEADTLGVDGGGVELVGVDARRVHEVAPRREASLELEKVLAGDGVYVIFDREDPGGGDEDVVAHR